MFVKRAAVLALSTVLLAACGKAETVRRVVVKSTTAVYGASPRDPAVFTEETPARALPGSGYAKDAVEVEGYVRGFCRRRPDVAVTTLRFANFAGPFIDTPLTRYFQLPVVPTALGFDPRFQLVHEIDAIEVLRLAATTDRPGTFNVAGNGVLLLSQAIRRAGKLAVAVPVPAVAAVGRAMRRSGLVDFSPEQTQFLNFGRVVSNQRLKDEFGYLPSYSTEEAFDSLLPELRSLISPELVAAAERRLARLLRLPVARPAVPADPLRAARSGNARSGNAGSGTVRHG